MDSGEWVRVFGEDHGWTSVEVFVNPKEETAKICSSKCSYWGYHDESEWDDFEEIVSIKRALGEVYPDEKAISAILSLVNKDYSDTLKN